MIVGGGSLEASPLLRSAQDRRAGSWMGELKLHVKAMVLPAQHIGVPSRHQARMLQGAARW